MNQLKMKKLLKAMPFVAPPNRVDKVRLSEVLVSWVKCHPYIRDMQADEDALETIGHMIYLELHREEGARPWMVDRLYMRYSNFRRTYEGALLDTIDATVMHAA